MSDINKSILVYRYIDKLSYQQIAEKLNTNRRRIKQIENHIAFLLRHYIEWNKNTIKILDN
jgi:DNA-directed RNA polymerase specialized sigma subunit